MYAVQGKIHVACVPSLLQYSVEYSVQQQTKCTNQYLHSSQFDIFVVLLKLHKLNFKNIAAYPFWT